MECGGDEYKILDGDVVRDHDATQVLGSLESREVMEFHVRITFHLRQSHIDCA